LCRVGSYSRDHTAVTGEPNLMGVRRWAAIGRGPSEMQQGGANATRFEPRVHWDRWSQWPCCL
jgi:hypothetical protein